MIVLPQLSAEAPSADYDRAGSGWSDPVKLPRTSTQVTDELRELLRVAGVPAPYLLVGHSLGGLYARHYAVRFPDEVAALLLLDPAHEDYNAYMPQELTKMWGGVEQEATRPADEPCYRRCFPVCSRPRFATARARYQALPQALPRPVRAGDGRAGLRGSAICS